MTWSDFLRYSKYIAVFYAIAFVMALVGIWAGGGVDYKLLWSAALFFCTAIAANVALGVYHSNHKSEMRMAKNIHLAKQSQTQVITSDTKDLAVPEQDQLAAQLLEDGMRDIIRREVRKERGY
jgi:hypothetical protein